MSLKIFCACIYACLLVSIESKPKYDYKTKKALAEAHVARMMPKLSCKVPQPRLVKLETDELIVKPEATVLHRCDGSTGCCDFDTHRCVAKKIERVKLFVFVMPRHGHSYRHVNGKARKREMHRTRVEKFVRANHTECHCENIVDSPK